MDASEVLRLVRRWWWILILGPLAAAVSAYLVSSAMTPIYSASATLLIEQNQVSNGSSYQDLLYVQQLTNTYSRLVTTRSVLSKTVNDLGLSLTPEGLAAKVTVSPIRDTQLVRVSVSDPSPRQAAAIANTIADVFIAQMREQEQATTGSSREELQRSIEQVRQQIDDTNAQLAQAQATPSPSQSEITALQQRLGQLQTNYGSLLEAQQRMAIAEAQVGARLRVAEQAVPPANFVSPRITLNTALGAVLGMLLAAGVVMLLGYLDNTVKTSEDVTRLTGRSSIGSIPALQTTDQPESLARPRSPATEGYRGLRTNLQFIASGSDLGSVVVTSLRPGDGKTTTVTNLAIVLAQGGQSVVLIDGDLRKPRIHRQFSGLTNRLGLTNALLAPDIAEVDRMLQKTEIPNLQVLTTGPLPPNPPDVLSSPRMQEMVRRLETEADVVLIDAPPMAVSDPLILAGVAKGVILVTFAGRTRSNELEAAVARLEPTGTPLLGVVLNRVDLGSEGYYYYYRSYYEAGNEPPSMPGSGTGEEPEREPSQRRGSIKNWRSLRAQNR